MTRTEEIVQQRNVITDFSLERLEKYKEDVEQYKVSLKLKQKNKVDLLKAHKTSAQATINLHWRYI